MASWRRPSPSPLNELDLVVKTKIQGGLSGARGLQRDQSLDLERLRRGYAWWWVDISKRQWCYARASEKVIMAEIHRGHVQERGQLADGPYCILAYQRY
jgi:hypothetical protein